MKFKIAGFAFIGILLSIGFFVFRSVTTTKTSHKVVAWDLHNVLFTHPLENSFPHWGGADCTPREEVFAVAKKLHAQGVKQVILSNISQASFEELKAKYPEYFVYFDLDHSLADAHFIFDRKPYRQYYDRFLSRVEEKPENVFFIDDKESNIVSARKRGMNGHTFKTVQALEQALALA